MANYPKYVTPACYKKYDKLYRNLRYKDDDIISVMTMFGIDKLDNKELYFQDRIDMTLVDYILKCLLLDVRNVYSENVRDNAKSIGNMERSDLTKAFQFFIPKCKKYSLIDLVNLICSYKPKVLSEAEILDMIISCPDNRVLSLDLMLYVNKKSPCKYTSFINIISNDELIFEYIHNVLFGKDSTSIDKGKSNTYLCIDTGKDVPESKIKEYKIVNNDHKLVSNNNDIISYTVKILSRVKNVDISDFVDISPVSEERPKRKAIPKAVRNQLWKKYFGDSIKGSCCCCKAEIDALTHFEAGHIVAAAKGGSDNVDNLRPVCMSCNRSMGTMNMDDYIKKYITS